ncbi:aspartate kinase [Wolbachia endosymbiont of Pentidionis agamae]|uniref:aspartate kinase n=1 Tax=Wolbachia endosymbiont of Pentidionis agamae TaxID=3110435 RepID=UPI002FD342A4
MSNIIIKKFGGTSLTDLNRVTYLIKAEVDRGYKVIVVVSAIADFTDQMINKVSNFNYQGVLSEYDVVLSAGEQISCGLLTIALHSIGVIARSWLAWQLPIITDNLYSQSRIKKICTDNLKNSLFTDFSVAVVAGFQGLHNDRITTFGRGGSDISAVALAIAFNIKTCDIFTDIDGIYTADPKIVSKARKLQSISYTEMLEISSSGAKILHIRAVELAMKHDIKIKVLPTFQDTEGTVLVHEHEVLERYLVTGIVCNLNEAMLTLTDITNDAEVLKRILDSNIKISMINCLKNLSFVVAKSDVATIEKLLSKNKNITINRNIARVSVIGIAVVSNAEVLLKIFKVLSENKIKMLAITVLEIKITILVKTRDAYTLVRALHTEYGLDIQ